MPAEWTMTRSGSPSVGSVLSTIGLTTPAMVAIFKLEVVPVPPGLQREEGSVEAHGHDCDEGALPNRQRRPRRRLRKVGQQQAERDQRQDHPEIGVRALQIVVLL